MGKRRSRKCQQKVTSAGTNGVKRRRETPDSASTSSSSGIKSALCGGSQQQSQPGSVGDVGNRRGKGRSAKLLSLIKPCSVVLIRLTPQETQDMKEGKKNNNATKKTPCNPNPPSQQLIANANEEVADLDVQNIDNDEQSETEDILISCQSFVPSKNDVKAFLQKTKKLDLVGAGLALADIAQTEKNQRGRLEHDFSSLTLSNVTSGEIEVYSEEIPSFPMKPATSGYHDVPEKILTHSQGVIKNKNGGTDCRTVQILLVKWKEDPVPKWIEADHMHQHHGELVSQFANLPTLISSEEFEGFFNAPSDNCIDDIQLEGIPVQSPGPGPDAAAPNLIPNPTTRDEEEPEVVTID